MSVTELFGDKVVGCYESSNGEWVKFDDIKEFLKPTANIDYTAALEVEIDVFHRSKYKAISESELHELATRLNSVVKAQQNCA